MRVGELIRSDLYRYHGRVGVVPFLKSWLMNRRFNYTLWFRLANVGLPLLSQIAALWLRGKQTRYGVELLKGTEVGPGLYIGHGGPCIIHPSALIGSNVNLSQFVTIGSNHGKAAVIGNNVTIGAGSVFTRSVPDNCTAAGNPARVLNQNNPERYVNKRRPLQET